MQKAFSKSLGVFLMTIAFSVIVFAQGASVKIEQKREAAGVSILWFVVIFVMAVTLAAVIFELFKRKKAAKEAAKKSSKRRSLKSGETLLINADREINWAQKKLKTPPKKNAVKKSRKTFADEIAKTKSIEIPANKAQEPSKPLPVFGINKIERARPFAPLPISDDELLLDAIEQVHEEFEEDAEGREIALKILAAFKTQNSVEAISQVALYDFSSGLRSRAISVLADFDHESVFETVLLACADPTREVRAAAARALFRLSFERKEAWLRISEFEDSGRLRQCARALVAGDLVVRSLERLTHRDQNYAAEAFAIAVLLIKAEETEEVFAFLKTHSDSNLQKAILHVIKIANEPNALEKLSEMSENFDFSGEIRTEIDAVLESSEVFAT